MSFEADQIQSLRIAIRDEFPSLREEIRELNREIKINNIFKMIELDNSNPELNLFTNEEKVELLRQVKNEMNIKQKTKRK